MGQASSQPVPQSPKPAGGRSLSQASPAPQHLRYSPSADDVQASQQLLTEEAHDEHDLDSSRGSNDTHGQDMLTLLSTMDSVSSQWSLLYDVEGLGSQRWVTSRQPTVEPFTPEPPSSFAVAASVLEKASPIFKKGSGRKPRYSDRFREQDTWQDLENTVASTTESPQTKLLRTPNSNWAMNVTKREMTPGHDSDITEGAPSRKRRSCRKSTAPKSTKERLPEFSDDGEIGERIRNQYRHMALQRVKSKLRILKKSKSSELKQTNPQEDEDQSVAAVDEILPSTEQSPAPEEEDDQSMVAADEVSSHSEQSADHEDAEYLSIDAAVESQLHAELAATPEDSEYLSMDAVADVQPGNARFVTPGDNESLVMDEVPEMQPLQECSANPEKRKAPSMDKVAEEQPHAEQPVQQARESSGHPLTRRLLRVEIPVTSKKRKRTRKKLYSDLPSDQSLEVGQKFSTPGRRYSRKSTVDTSLTAAERELNKLHTLNRPLVLPDSGKFSTDEDEVLQRAIKIYQEANNLEIDELIEIIHWTGPRYGSQRRLQKFDWSGGEEEFEAHSKELWSHLGETEPRLNRSLLAIKGRVRARYHGYKSGEWTEDEDKRLEQLVKEFPNMWKQISCVLVDRSPLDLQNRWKDYVQFGGNRNTGRWSLEEERALLKALRVVIQEDHEHRESKGLPLVANYSTKDVKWPEVCDLMGNVRSRLQCQDHWREMKTRDASAYIKPMSKERFRLWRRMPGVAQMRLGDKCDLVDALAECEYIENEEGIDWGRTVLRMRNTFPVDDLQTVLKELLKLVKKKENFTETIRSVSDYLLDNYSRAELRVIFDPLTFVVKEEGKPNKKRKNLSGRALSSVKRQKRESLG